MNSKEKDLITAFHGKLVGNAQMKLHVARTLAKMPRHIVNFVNKNCWFLGSFEDAWAFTFTGNYLKDHHLIFISDELLLQPDNQIRYTIAHEIGHVMLNHRNSTLVRQSKAEIGRQEKEADNFAKKYAYK